MVEQWEKLSYFEDQSACLSYPEWIKYVRNTFASVVEHCFKHPSWLGCIKFIEIDSN